MVLLRDDECAMGEGEGEAVSGSGTLEARGYVLLDRLGRGGFAEVFSAELRGASGFTRRVAIKVLREDREGDLSQEAVLAGRLRHPNLVEVLDLVDVQGRLHLVMELLDNGTAATLARRGPVAPEAAAYIADQVLEGLMAAHASGVLAHRDVTPANILFSARGEVKLADFGIAKDKGSTDKTETGFVKGKVGYLAPEQIEGGPVDPRTDLWALGVALVELLTGRRLFGGPGRTDREVLAEIARQHGPAVPADLGEAEGLRGFLSGLLQPDLVERFASAGHAQEVLREVWGGPPERVGLLHALQDDETTRNQRRPTATRPHRTGRIVAKSQAGPRRRAWFSQVAVGLGCAILGAALGVAAMRLQAQPQGELQGRLVRLEAVPVATPTKKRAQRTKPIQRTTAPAAAPRPAEKAHPREVLNGAYFEAGGTLEIDRD